MRLTRDLKTQVWGVQVKRNHYVVFNIPVVAWAVFQTPFLPNPNIFWDSPPKKEQKEEGKKKK